MNGWKVIGKRRAVYLAALAFAAAFALIIGAGAPDSWGRDDADDACTTARGPAQILPTAKLMLDWTKLCVYDPRGRQILEVEPKQQLKSQSISGIFFESAEPPNAEVPIEEFLARFPEGRYPVRGRTLDGHRITGAATFTHNIPAGPEIIFPQDGDVVSLRPSEDLVIRWKHVRTTITGQPIKRTGYQVIITKDVRDDPHGFSRPTFDVHVPPSVTSLTVSREFLEPNTGYELEVLVLEVSGNQTISSLFFKNR
jgi:hypothetical protein